MLSPIAVVGAGPAGLTAALALRRLGLEATVFEQAEDFHGVSGAPADWADSLPAARVIDKANGRVVVELEAGSDEQAVLDVARSVGRVTHFSAVEPTLTELFRQAVQA